MMVLTSPRLGPSVESGAAAGAMTLVLAVVAAWVAWALPPEPRRTAGPS